MDVRWDVTSPQSKVVGTHRCKGIIRGRDVMDESQFLIIVVAWQGIASQSQRWKWEDSGSLPLLDGILNLGIHH